MVEKRLKWDFEDGFFHCHNQKNEALGVLTLERVGRHFHYCWYQHENIRMSPGCLQEVRDKQKEVLALWREEKKKNHIQSEESDEVICEETSTPDCNEGATSGGTAPTKYGVVGNRKGWTFKFVKNVLEKLKVGSEDVIISGGAQGVDTYAQEYARQNGVELWVLYPKPSVPSPLRYFERNIEIAERCDVLVAFDKGSSATSGTLSTVNHAKKCGKKVVMFSEEGGGKSE